MFDYKQYDGLGLAALIRNKEVTPEEVQQAAITMPLHVTRDGLPCGVQVMARRGREDLLLQLAGQLEQSSIWVDVKSNPNF